MGYHQAGFEVIGVDIEDQPYYPFGYYKADALTFPLDDFDLIHASPPCQLFSNLQSLWGNKESHLNLIPETREKLQESGKWFVIENVPRAPLHKDLVLCGSMFNLGVRRHRVFELNFQVDKLKCDHYSQGYVVSVHGNPGGSSKRDNKKLGSYQDWCKAMDIDWLPAKELAQAIPPAYTKYIGEQFLL